MIMATHPQQRSPIQDEPRMRRVVVLVEFDDTWGRNVLEAFTRYAQDANWQLLFAPRDAERRLRAPQGWSGDGAVVSLRDASMIEHVRSLGVPTVDVSNMFPDETWLARVATDDVGRARMAFDHFRNRHLEHFASYAPRIGRYPDQRAEVFCRTSTEGGFSCEAFVPSGPGSSSRDSSELADWLGSLPKPVGVFASDPYPARQLAETCVRHGLDVPAEIAILSGDDDELLCDIMSPGISSVELASHRIGFEAASLLGGMMEGEQPPLRAKLIEPLRVCSRQSTDYLAIDDPDLANVVRMVWDHASDGIQVSDLVRVAMMSRRSLEQRFRDVLGRSPAEEIRRVKVEKARRMMVTTSMSVAAVALACGFSSGPYLAQAFRKQYGIKPSDLRLGRQGAQPIRMPSPREDYQ